MSSVVVLVVAWGVVDVVNGSGKVVVVGLRVVDVVVC